MNILIFGNLSDEYKEAAREILDKTSTLFYYNDLNENDKESIFKEIDIVIGGRLSEEQLEKAKKLKMQQIFGTGVNSHNLKHFKENGILFCNSHAHSIVIAEYGFSMLLSASKKLHTSDKLLRQGNWDPQRGTSVTLLDKTILFLGYGEIAKHVKNFCTPFNMKYLAIKRTKECEDQDIEVFLPDDKEIALQQADFIFNSLPLTTKTMDFLDEDSFKIMKPNAIIVNVGRGGTINDKALYGALKNNRISGAAIDVWYNYPERRSGGQPGESPEVCLPSDYPFQELDNIIMTAHRAWVTDISFSELRKQLFYNVNRFIRGEPVKNIVDLDEEY